MKKSPAKKGPRSNSAAKSKEKNKLSYQSTKKILFNEKVNNNFVILQKKSLLPILNAYEPRILKHIIITDEKLNPNNHKNCEIHGIGIKSIISYFIEWKKTIATNLRQLESVLCEMEEDQIKKGRDRLINMVKNVGSVNDMMGKKLQDYIAYEAQHYISSQLQSHKQHPPNKHQPVAKQSTHIIAQNNYSKLSTIQNDYQYLKNLTLIILDIFYTLQKVLRLKTKEKYQGKINDDDIGGIVFQDLEKILMMEKGNNGQDSTITKKKEEKMQQYVERVSGELWLILDMKISQAFVLCDARTDIGFAEVQENLTPTLHKKSSKHFLMMERQAKTSKQSTWMLSNGEYSSFDKTQLITCDKSFNSKKKLQKLALIQTPKTISASKMINFNLIKYKLKKLFPCFVKQVIQQTKDILVYRNIIHKYAELLSKVGQQINESLSMEYQQNNRQDDITGEKGNKRLLRIEKRYSQFQSKIKFMLEQAVKYKQEIRQISKVVEQIRKDKDQQYLLTLDNILRRNNQVDQLIEYLRAALQLYFYQLMDGFLQEIESQSSILELIKDEGRVYNWVKKCLTLMITVEVEDLNIGQLASEKHEDKETKNVSDNSNKQRESRTSKWTAFLTQASRSYSTLLTTMIQLPTEITLLCRQNNLPITIQNQQKSYYEETIKYFDSIIKVVEQYLSIKQKVGKELRQKLINKQFIDRLRENIKVLSERQTGNKLLEEIHKEIKENIQFAVLKLTPQSNQGQRSSPQMQQLTSQQLTILRKFLQLIKSSQHDIQSTPIFINPQSYFTSLLSTDSQLLTHQRLIADISILNRVYKQYMNILGGSELVQFVIKESQVKNVLVGKVVNENALGQLVRDKRLEKNSLVKISSGVKQQAKSNNLELAFPKVPMILNSPSQASDQSSNVETTAIPISKILNQKLLITSYPIVQKIRLKALQLYKIAGKSIDNQEKMKQMEKFKQQFDEQMKKLKEVANGEVVEKVVREMVRIFLKEWEEMIRGNWFGKSIRLSEVMKIIRFIEVKDPNNPISQQQRQTLTHIIQNLKQLLISLQSNNNNEEQQQTENIKSNKEKAKRNIEILAHMIKTLELSKFDEFRVRLKEFLQQNEIVIVQYEIEASGKSGQQELKVNKVGGKNGREESELIASGKKKLSKLIILLKKVNKNRNNQQQQQNYEMLNMMLILRESDVYSLLSKTLPRKIVAVGVDQKDKIIDNKQQYRISKDDLSSLQHHFQQIQMYINEIIEKLKIFRNQSKQQQNRSIFKQHIDDLNKHIGQFSILMAKIIMECWLKQRVENDNDVVNSGWANKSVMIKILSLLEWACRSIVREWVLKKSFGNDKTDDSKKNTFCFGSGIEYTEQKDIFIRFLTNPENPSFDDNPLVPYQKSANEVQISPQILHKLYQQIVNLIEFLSCYPLQKNTNYQIVRLSQADYIVYWHILNRKGDALMKRKQQPVLQLLYKLFNEQSLRSQNRLLPTIQMLTALSHGYEQQCCIHDKLPQTTNNYYQIRTISVQKLLQQFILRTLIADKGLTLSVMNDNNIVSSIGKIVSKMISQLNAAIGVWAKSRSTKITLFLQAIYNEFLSNIHCVQYFYYQYYRQFITYLNQITSSDNSNRLNDNKAATVDQNITLKVQQLIHIWIRMEELILSSRKECETNNRNININEIMLKLYQIINQLVILETSLITIYGIKQTRPGGVDMSKGKWQLIRVIDNKNAIMGMLLLTQKELQDSNYQQQIATTALSHYQHLILQHYFWNRTQHSYDTNMKLLLQPHISKKFIQQFTNTIKINVNEQQTMIKQIEFKIENNFIVLDLFPVIKEKQMQQQQTGQTSFSVKSYKQRLCKLGKSLYDLEKNKEQIAQLVNQMGKLIQYAKWKQHMMNGLQFKYQSNDMKELEGQKMGLLQKCISVETDNEVDESSSKILKQEEIKSLSIISNNEHRLSTSQTINTTFIQMKKQSITQVSDINVSKGYEGSKSSSFTYQSQYFRKAVSQVATNASFSGEFLRQSNYSSDNSQSWVNNKRLLERLNAMRENGLSYLKSLEGKYFESGSLFIQTLMKYLSYNNKQTYRTNCNNRNNTECTPIYWQKLMLNTKYSGTDKTQHTHPQPLLSMSENEIRSFLNSQLQALQKSITERKNSKKNDKKQSMQMKEITEQVQMFMDLAQKIICQMHQRMTTTVFITLPLTQGLAQKSDDSLSVRHEIKCQGSQLTSNTYQLETSLPLFPIINAKWQQSAKTITTTHELLSRVFTQFIIQRQILLPSRVELLNQRIKQLSSYRDKLQEQFKNQIYSYISKREKQHIALWNANWFEYQKKIRDEATKRRAHEVLVGVLILFAEKLFMQRELARQKEQSRPIEYELQSRQDKLQIQVVLSEGWSVDQIDFNNYLNEYLKKKFIEKKEQVAISKLKKKNNC